MVCVLTGMKCISEVHVLDEMKFEYMSRTSIRITSILYTNYMFSFNILNSNYSIKTKYLQPFLSWPEKIILYFTTVRKPIIFVGTEDMSHTFLLL